MDPRGEFAHSIRNPLAAVDANLHFLKEVCEDLQRAVEAVGTPHDPALWADLDPHRLIREAREALGDSSQAVQKIRALLGEWVEGKR
jgi:hypothetical protein